MQHEWIGIAAQLGARKGTRCANRPETEASLPNEGWSVQIMEFRNRFLLPSTQVGKSNSQGDQPCCVRLIGRRYQVQCEGPQSANRNFLCGAFGGSMRRHAASAMP
jgi:hypothetical protein